MTCAGMVNILKYVPGVQGVDEMSYPLALIPDVLKTQKMCEISVMECPWALEFVPDCFKTKRMCKCAIENNLWVLRYVPDHFKTKKMCNEAVRRKSYTLRYVPDHFKTKRMCERALRMDPYNLEFVPDYFKIQKICDKAVKGDPYSLLFVPDWFVTHQQLKIWHDDDEYCNSYELIEWYNGCKKRKAQKASIKEGLLPIAWLPSRWWDWCLPEDEKKETEKLRG